MTKQQRAYIRLLGEQYNDLLYHMGHDTITRACFEATWHAFNVLLGYIRLQGIECAVRYAEGFDGVEVKEFLKEITFGLNEKPIRFVIP